MVYYRVKPEYDQTPRIKNSRKAYNRVPKGVFVANELYTARELLEFYLTEGEALRMFKEVRVKRSNTYIFFGARFEYGKGPATYEG